MTPPPPDMTPFHTHQHELDFWTPHSQKKPEDLLGVSAPEHTGG